MECKKEENIKKCLCMHTECSRHGVCCECLSYHLGSRELPACCFPDEIARTDERSFEKFIEVHK